MMSWMLVVSRWLCLLLLVVATLASTVTSQVTPTNSNTRPTSTTTTTSGRGLSMSAITNLIQSQLVEATDLTQLNALLNTMVLEIPGEFETDGGSGPLIERTLTVSEITCRKFHIDQVHIDAEDLDNSSSSSSSEESTSSTSLKLELIRLDLECSMNYLWDKLVDDTRGTIDLVSHDNSVAIEFGLFQDLDTDTPKLEFVVLDNCQASIHVQDLDFSRDSFLGSILDVVEPLLRGPVADALETTVCDQFHAMTDTVLPQLFQQVTGPLLPFLLAGNLTVGSSGPLQEEYQLQQWLNSDGTLPPAPPLDGNDPVATNHQEGRTPSYINFQEPSSDQESASRIEALTHLVLDLVDTANEWLGSPSTTSSPSSSSNNNGWFSMIGADPMVRRLASDSVDQDMLGVEDDLGMNQIIRSFVLNDNRTFVWEPQNMTVAEVGDFDQSLLSTRLVLDKVTIVGLDSLTHFDALDRIGQQTLQSCAAWDVLQVQADWTVEMQNNAGSTLQEDVVLKVSGDDLEAIVSVFVALEETLLGQTPLRALLDSKAMPECFLATLYPYGDFLSQLNVSMGNLNVPLVDGFDSGGVTRIFQELLELIYHVYEPWFLEALPTLSETTVRDYLNTLWDDFKNRYTPTDSNDVVCPRVVKSQNNQDEFVDFRDLLLDPKQAKAMGGSGDQPYGDMVSMAMDLIQNQLFTVADGGGDDNELALNSVLLRPLTEWQSGKPGTLHFPSSLVHVNLDTSNAPLVDRANTPAMYEAPGATSLVSEIMSYIFDSFVFGLSDLQIRNLDTLVAPSYFLQPTSSDAYVVENLLKLGPVSDKLLNASIRLYLGMEPTSKRRRQMMRVLEDPEEMMRVLEDPEESSIDPSFNGPPEGNSPDEPSSDASSASGSSASLDTTENTSPVTRNLVAHEMDLSLSTETLQIVADILAKVDATNMQNFPLEDLADFNCWFGLVPVPVLDEDGKLSTNNANEPMGFLMEDFLLGLGNVTMDMQCVNMECRKSSLGILSHLAQIWQESNVTDTLGDRIGAFASEFMEGDFVETFVARSLRESSRKCPHHDLFNSSLPSYPPLDWPILSEQSLDSMAFAAFTAIQAGLLVLSESHQNSSSQLLGSSSGQVVEPSPELAEKRLIDFTKVDSTGTVAELVSYVFHQANTVLYADSDSAQGGINEVLPLILANYLDGEGVLTLPLVGLALVDISTFKVKVKTLKVFGLNSFTKFDVFKAAGPQLLHNEIGIDNLRVEVALSLNSGSFERDFVVSLEAADISASIPIYAAIDADILEAIELGELMDVDTVLACIFTAVHDMKVPTVSLNVGKIGDLSVEGLFPATGMAFATSMSAITDEFGLSVDGSLDSVLYAVLNGIISFYRRGAKCDNVMIASQAARRIEETATAFLDFRDLLLKPTMAKAYGATGLAPYGDLFRTVYSFVQDLILAVDPVTGIASINDRFIAPLSQAASNVSGSLIMAGRIIDKVQKLNVGGLNAVITFRVSDARVENLDTMGDPIALLAPVQDMPHLLNNSASFGNGEEKPLRFSTRVLIGVDSEDTNMLNDVELSVDLHTATMVLTALLKVMENEFATFPIGDIMNLDCWLAKMPAPALDEYGFRLPDVKPSAALSELEASVKEMDLHIKCFSCTSPDLKDFNIEGSEDLDIVMNKVLDYITDLLGGKFLQVQIDRALNDATKRCPHSPDYDPAFVSSQYKAFESEPESSMTFLLMLLIVTAVALAILGLVVISRKCFVRARHRRLLRLLPDRELYLLQMEQEQEDKRAAELNAVTCSLFQSSSTIPAFVRYLVPVAILGNMGLFLSGHLSLGATVNIEAQLAGETIRFEEFFSFSMAKSTIDIWNAGGKTLAALIFIFSGLWPYTKCLMTLVLWFMPPSKVAMATRGTVLLWLDALAKWSMVDIFVLLVSIAGFRVSIGSPSVDFLPESFYSVDLLVVPMWGLYANMLAQILSQISSHFIIYYHRRVVNKATRARRAIFRKTADFLQAGQEDEAEGFLDEQLASPSFDSSDSVEEQQAATRKDCLYKHAFVRPHSDNNKLVARFFMNPLLITFALSMAAFLIAGCIVPSFSLEIMGIMGVLVESGNQWKQAVEKYSVFSITELLMDQAAFIDDAGQYIGLGILSALLVLTVLVVPLIQTIALLYHWYAPMNKNTRHRMEVLLETTQAWQYVEVYLIAVIVSAWQLGPISEFMINSYCGSLKDTFSMLVYYGILAEEDAQCFRVEAKVESAAFLLAAASMLLALLNSYISNASHQYFRDVENRSKFEFSPSSHPVAALPRKNGASLGEKEVDLPQKEDPLAAPANPEMEGWCRSKAVEKIHPVPVLFTDMFRWTLIGKDDDNAGAFPVQKEDEVPAFLEGNTDRSEETESLLVRGDPVGNKGTISELQPTKQLDDELETFEDEGLVRKVSDFDHLDGNLGDKDADHKLEAFEDYELAKANRDDVFVDEEVNPSVGNEDWDSDSEDEDDDDGIGRGAVMPAGIVQSNQRTDDATCATSVSESTRTSYFGGDDDLSTVQSSVLLGSGSLILEANGASTAGTNTSNNSRVLEDVDLTSSSVADTDFQDEMEEPRQRRRPRGLRSSLQQAQNNLRRSARASRNRNEPPRGNSTLQAAFMDDQDLPPVS